RRHSHQLRSGPRQSAGGDDASGTEYPHPGQPAGLYPRTDRRSQPCGADGRHEHPRRRSARALAAQGQQPAYGEPPRHLSELEAGAGTGPYPAQPQPRYRAGGRAATGDFRPSAGGHAHSSAPQRVPHTRQPSCSALMPRRWLLPLRHAWLLAAALLAGCAGGLKIDTSHSARGQDSRVQYVIVHYTSSNAERAMNTLTRGEVSSHYLINDVTPTIYRLVDEDRRAWHAGDSSWHDRTWLNASSIGIEIVHPGYRDTDAGRQWYHWNPQQIDQLILLLQDILQRHDLPPDRVLGHSDIAPQRKLDPGPLFPWQQLAEAGVAIWPDEAR